MKFGIYRKVLVLACSLIILFSWIFGAFFSRLYIQALRQEMDLRGEVLVQSLAVHGEYAVMINDAAAIERLVKGVLLQKDAVFCRIEGADGALLHQDGSREGPVKVYTAPIVATKAAESRGEELILGAPGEREEVVGRIFLALSLHDLAVAERQTRRIALIAGLLASIVSSFILYLVIRRILGRPIAELVAATRRISGGDLDYQVPITTRDEVGALAASFNTMTRSLRDTQEELVRKEKLSILGQLSGSVGHELRNPLGIISNAVYFLQTVMPGADETVKEYLEIIRNEVNNAERIIADLLDFARTKTPHARPATAAELIRLGLGKSVIPENVTLATDVPEGLPAVAVDPLQMGQVFQNLITNAVQAMPGGGSLRIAARLAGAPPRGDFVEIAVSDTGCGIPPEHRKKLFQPLFTTKAKGIGLGLVVLKKLTEANGGAVGVQSEAGKGTTFTITLPVAGAR